MNDRQTRTDEQSKPPLRFNKQISVFLVCLVIAIVFWLLLSLSGNYSTSITFPVKYTHLPDRKLVVNELPTSIKVDLKTSGFRILTYGFKQQLDTITIDLAAGMTASGRLRDAIEIPTRNFSADFTRQLGAEVDVMGFDPDTILVLFSDKAFKKVPVFPNVLIQLDRQFDTVAAPATIPDSIVVSGPPSALRKIKKVSTRKIELSNLKTSIDKAVELEVIPLVEFDPSVVQLKVEVEKFTEGIQEVPIHAVSVPAGYSLKMFPEKVTVRYQVALSNYKSVNVSQFDIVADASALPASDISMLPLRVVARPEMVRAVSMDPAEVEFILRKK
ncbi:MAG: hypothetical protein RIQ47_256 [Bacteroidota bacterium]